MEKKYEVRRDFELQGVGIPDEPIKPLFDKELVYQFELKTEEYETEDGEKKTYEEVVFNNDYFQCSRRVLSLPNDKDAPKIFNGLKIFDAFNPFSKNDWNCCINLVEINLELTLLMFKLGYCDGILCRKTPFGMSTCNTPIIAVDPEKREELRSFTEENWKEFLSKIDIKDFAWAAFTQGYMISYDKKWSTATDHRFGDCWDDTDKFVTKREKEKDGHEPEWDVLSHDDRVAGLSLITYFSITGGVFEKPEDFDLVPVFKTEESAKLIVDILKNNYTTYSERRGRRELYIQPVNLKFCKYLCEKANN